MFNDITPEINDLKNEKFNNEIQAWNDRINKLYAEKMKRVNAENDLMSSKKLDK